MIEFFFNTINSLLSIPDILFVSIMLKVVKFKKKFDGKYY